MIDTIGTHGSKRLIDPKGWGRGEGVWCKEMPKAAKVFAGIRTHKRSSEDEGRLNFLVKPMTKGFNKHKGLFFQKISLSSSTCNLRNVKLGFGDLDLVLKLEI